MTQSIKEGGTESVKRSRWTSWCPPCRAEMPAIDNVYQTHKENGLEVLAVNSTFQDSEADAADFAQELELSFPGLIHQRLRFLQRGFGRRCRQRCS